MVKIRMPLNKCERKLTNEEVAELKAQLRKEVCGGFNLHSSVVSFSSLD